MSVAKTILISFASLFICQCVSLQSVSITEIPQKRTKQISVSESKWVILGLNFNNEYTENVVTGLKKKCPFGKVSGILTKYYTKNYFIVSKHMIDAKGFCIQKGKKV